MSAIWSSNMLWVPAGVGVAPGGVTRTRPWARPGVAHCAYSTYLGRLCHAGAVSLLLMYIIYLAGRSLFYASAAYF